MRKIPCFDSHCDTVTYCLREGRHLTGGGTQVSLDYADRFSSYTQFFALYWDMALPIAHPLREEFCRQRDWFLAELAAHPELAAHCKNKREIEAAHAAGKAAALLSIEDANLLECDPANLELAAEAGVQAIALTWNYRNGISGSCADCPDVGLSDRGRAFVKESERLGILMDVSHLSPKGFWDLFEMAERPIVATHSDSDAVFHHRRNLTDDQFRAIMESGGVVGLNYFVDFLEGTKDIPQLIRHLEHFLDLGGENHIGLGGDLDGCREVCHGLDDLRGVPKFWAALEQRGYGEALLRKLFFDNWMRLVRA